MQFGKASFAWSALQALTVSTASVIDPDCPGGLSCTPHGKVYLQTHNDYNPQYALMRSQWCQDHGFHYKVWSEVFLQMDKGDVFDGYEIKHEYADELTLYLLERLIPVELFGLTMTTLHRANFRRDRTDLGAFPVAQWLTERCIPVNDFLKHFNSLRDVYEFDPAITHAQEALKSQANGNCLVTKAQLNCIFAQVQCGGVVVRRMPSGMSPRIWWSMSASCRKILDGCKSYKYKKDVGKEECVCERKWSIFTWLGPGLCICCCCCILPGIGFLVYSKKSRERSQARAALEAPAVELSESCTQPAPAPIDAVAPPFCTDIQMVR